MPEPERKQVILSLSKSEAEALLFDWRFWARPDQMAPAGDWQTWLLMAGRGYGKTRTGAEWIRDQVEHHGKRRIALVAPTAADTRDVMIEGESGLLSVCPPWNMPIYEPSKRRLTWPSGAIATAYSAEEPKRLRGPQHDAAWADEITQWQYEETWDMLMFGLRLGADPRCVATTTPKPLKFLRALIADPMTALTTGTTYDNLENLAPAFARKILAKYEGTRLGQQELHAQILDDIVGALWSRSMIETGRLKTDDALPDMARVVVAVDPAVTSREDSDETGIIVAGKGVDGRGYVLRDLSCQLSPDGWARRAVNAYHEYHADRIVAEVNNGGDMVEFTVRTVDKNAAYKSVHASRGKRVRAEPIAALYEQGRISHVGNLGDLEDQLCSWTPDSMDDSPDRMDALVWALTDLMLEPEHEFFFGRA